jgi:hypothetical protein
VAFEQAAEVLKHGGKMDCQYKIGYIGELKYLHKRCDS